MIVRQFYFIISLLIIFYTALSAQENDNITIQYSDSIFANTKQNNKTMKIIGFAIPVAMITYGILSLESPYIQRLDYSTQNELIEDNSMFYNTADNFMQFSPGVEAFVLKASGLKSEHNYTDMVILYALSNLVESSVVYTAKHFTPRRRPDDSNGKSFPSGHTATAFVAAEFLHQEYKNESVWISVGGYSMATLIGASRVYNNKHWISDVVAGAGIGILSTKIVYLTYPYLQKAFGKKEMKHQTLVFPSYSYGAFGLNVSRTF